MHIEPPSPTVAGVARARPRRGAIVAVTALACAALISACGSSSPTSSTAAKTNLDTAHVAASIEQSIFSERHLHAKVSCPVAVPQQQGKTFTCIATTRAAKKPHTVSRTPFAVTIQNSKGYVTYKGQ